MCLHLPFGRRAGRALHGKINRLGVDIGNQSSAVLTYAVTALGTPAPGSLAGE